MKRWLKAWCYDTLQTYLLIGACTMLLTLTMIGCNVLAGRPAF